MRNLALTLIILLLAAVVADMSRLDLTRSEELPPLPVPVTNNAVVSVQADGKEFIISFAGLGAGKEHDDTHARTFVLNSEKRQWREAQPVPGGVGRLAAVAVAVGDKALVFGGYTVAADGAEESMRWVHAFDPVTGEFEERTSMPVPVDDAVAVVYQDRYVYLISGWHDFGNVNLVQRYDAVAEEWAQATPTPGPAVFGHAGGIVGDTIVYCDGVAVEPHANQSREFVAVGDCFAGFIDAEEGRRIDWRRIKEHPGKPRYRMAATGLADQGGVMFVGGSDNPYNYDGMGYDGRPSQPSDDALLFDVDSASWQDIDIDGPGTMDHRGLVEFEGDLVTIGGMVDDQQVSDKVLSYDPD